MKGDVACGTSAPDGPGADCRAVPPPNEQHFGSDRPRFPRLVLRHCAGQRGSELLARHQPSNPFSPAGASPSSPWPRPLLWPLRTSPRSQEAILVPGFADAVAPCILSQATRDHEAGMDPGRPAHRSSAARPCSSRLPARRTIGTPRPTIWPASSIGSRTARFEFYPTAIARQLMLPNFAEMLILQLRLLSGGDRLDNIVQWLAGAGSVVVVGRIALALGASRRGAALARLTAATLADRDTGEHQHPERSGGDLLPALHGRAPAGLAHEPHASEDAAFMAIAAGLALATKGTAYLIGLPLGLWFLVEILPAGRRALAPLLACGLAAPPAQSSQLYPQPGL